MSLFAMSNPAQADSVPDFDSWGPDIFAWSLQDWITWHRANVAQYGLAYANDVFTQYWTQQTFGAQPLNDLTFDPEARSYLNHAGVLQRLPVSWGGVLTDAIQAVGDATRNLPETGKALGWILPIALLVIVVGYVAPYASNIGKASQAFRNPRRYG